VDCQKPWTVVMSPDILWTYYLDVALLLFFYFMLALEIRRHLEPVCLLNCLDSLILICFISVSHSVISCQYPSASKATPE